MSEVFDWHPEELPEPTRIRDTRLYGFLKRINWRVPIFVGAGAIVVGLLDNPSQPQTSVVRCEAGVSAEPFEEIDGLPDSYRDLGERALRSLQSDNPDTVIGDCTQLQPDENGRYTIRLRPGETVSTYSSEARQLVVVMPPQQDVYRPSPQYEA